jgi:NTE family protein
MLRPTRMSPPGRRKGESLSAQREGSSMSPPGRRKGESLSAQREGSSMSPPGCPKGEILSAQREGRLVSPSTRAHPRPGRVASRLLSAALSAMLLAVLPGRAYAEAPGRPGSPATAAAATSQAGGAAGAPAPAAADAGSGAPARPRIALVLSGGGARGFAHIGVLRVLDELRVPVDVVTGTSMGAVVGGLYATGYTAAELEAMVRGTDWDSIFDRRLPRAELDWRRKEDDYKNLSDFELGIVDGGLTLPRGLAGTQRLEFFLRSLSGPSKRVRDLARLPVPFAAIGTDLETGRRVVLQKDVSLSTAMRASMSVPGAFAPVEVNGQLLVDGGVVDNLPVDAARAMGADIVIAVNVGTPLLRRDQIGNVVGVATQLTLMMGLETIERSIASLKPADVLITPALDGLGSGDFTEGARLIGAGEAAARQLADRLAALALPPGAYAQREALRTQLVREEGPFRVDEVRVAGTRAVRPEAVAGVARDLAGQTVTVQQIGPVLDRIYSSGDFESVSYSLVDEGGRSVLVVTPYEKSWGYNVLRLGGNVQTNFGDDNAFNLLVSHSWRWLNRWGGEWRNEVQIGDTRRLMSEWYQPLGAGSRWFVLPRLESLQQERNLFIGELLLSRYENTQLGAALVLGHEVPRLGSLRAGVGRFRLESAPLIGVQFDANTSHANVLLAQANVDTLDNVLFPLRGYYLDVRYRRYDKPVGLLDVRESISVDTVLPMSIGRYTTILSARGGTSDPQGPFQLGGLFNLTGTRTGEVAGDRGLLLRGLLFRNVSDLIDLKMPTYAGLSLEVGAALPRGASFEPADFRRAAALFVSVESLVGPVFFAVGRTFSGGSSGVYLYWGRPQ